MSHEALIQAFSEELGVAVSDETRFGSASVKVIGIFDGTQGVQWNAWTELRDNSAHFGINLEGMKYDGWPIARFIEREFRYPRFLEIAKQVTEPERVQVQFSRVAWQVSTNPSIREHQLGAGEQRLADLEIARWRAALRDAYRCLEPESGYRNRLTQNVTVNKKQVRLPVSPHFRIRTQLSSGSEGDVDLAQRIQTAKALLQPLHEYVTERSRP